MKSAAKSVDDYIAALPTERRASIARVRDFVRRRLPPGYTEGMGFGMITWSVPLERYSKTYNGQPLCYAGLASQKNYMSLYLMGAYADTEQRARLEQAYAEKGRRLDMGQSCLRFRSADELPLDLIGELIAAKSVDDMIALMESTRGKTTGRRAGTKKATVQTSGAKKSAPKKRAAQKPTARKSSAKNGGARKPAKRRSR